jgi:hypothetical protein
MSRSYDNYDEILRKHHPRSLGMNLCFIHVDWGFDNLVFCLSLLENITLALERLVVEILESFWHVTPTGHFNLCLFSACVCDATRLSGPFLPLAINSGSWVTLVLP